MFTLKKIIQTLVVITLALFTVTAQAAEQKLVLKGDFFSKAKAEAVIKDLEQGKKEITITATGLKPDSVYTVWLVNMKPTMDMIGVGQAVDYAFRSNEKGEGRYTATISTAELEKWQLFEIAYHPNGDAKDMKDMKVALKAKLRK